MPTGEIVEVPEREPAPVERSDRNPEPLAADVERAARGAVGRARRGRRRIEPVDGLERGRAARTTARVATARGTHVGPSPARAGGARRRSVPDRVDRVPGTTPPGGGAAGRGDADHAGEPGVRGGRRATPGGRSLPSGSRSGATRELATGGRPGPARRPADGATDRAGAGWLARVLAGAGRTRATGDGRRARRHRRAGGAPTRQGSGRGRSRRRHALRGELHADQGPRCRDGAARRAPGAREPWSQRHRRPRLDRARRGLRGHRPDDRVDRRPVAALRRGRVALERTAALLGSGGRRPEQPRRGHLRVARSARPPRARPAVRDTARRGSRGCLRGRGDRTRAGGTDVGPRPAPFERHVPPEASA